MKYVPSRKLQIYNRFFVHSSKIQYANPVKLRGKLLSILRNRFVRVDIWPNILANTCIISYVSRSRNLRFSDRARTRRVGRARFLHKFGVSKTKKIRDAPYMVVFIAIRADNEVETSERGGIEKIITANHRTTRTIRRNENDLYLHLRRRKVNWK